MAYLGTLRHLHARNEVGGGEMNRKLKRKIDRLEKELEAHKRFFMGKIMPLGRTALTPEEKYNLFEQHYDVKRIESHYQHKIRKVKGDQP